MFRPVSIRDEELITINKPYFTEDNFDKTMLEPLRAIYVTEGKHLTK